MPQPVGSRLPLSTPRRLIVDLMHVSRQVPSVPMERRLHLAPLVAARQAAEPRPSWCALFLKAYALVAARQPELRRAYIPFPRAHLYEHPVNIAAVAVERQVEGEAAVLFAHLRAPEEQSIRDLEAHLRRCKEDPLDSIGLFRRVLFVSRLPWPIRRLAWWLGLNLSGYRRARTLGTFGVSVTAGQGAGALHLISPLTTTLHYGVFEADGTLPVRLTFDHRVLDGATVARALSDLERVLLGEILHEVRGLTAREAA